VGDAAEDRHRRRPWPRLPALAGDADHLPGLQGLQHPPRHGTYGGAIAAHNSHAHAAPVSLSVPHCSNSTRSSPTSASPRTAPPAAAATSPPGSWAPTATPRRSTSPQVHGETTPNNQPCKL
jgi:hypothetical protein